MAEPTLGVLGGSGLYDLPGLEGVERLAVDTPFGAPSDELVLGRLGGARRGCCGARGRDLRVHGGPAVLDPRRVAPLPQLGRAGDRHDQPPGGEARARGGDLLRDPRARHRLRLLERGAGRRGDRGRAPGAGGQRRPGAAHGRARGGRVARAHRLPVPDRARPRDHHGARRHPRDRAARAGAALGEAPLSAITVVGSVAFDTIETPIGRAEEVLGGSATYFAVAASFFAPVSLVAVVGDDFPEAERDYLASHGIDLSGLEVRPGRTFRWSGRYHEDMNVRDTLALELNVFADFRPELSEAHRQ